MPLSPAQVDALEQLIEGAVAKAMTPVEERLTGRLDRIQQTLDRDTRTVRTLDEEFAVLKARTERMASVLIKHGLASAKDLGAQER